MAAILNSKWRPFSVWREPIFPLVFTVVQIKELISFTYIQILCTEAKVPERARTWYILYEYQRTLIFIHKKNVYKFFQHNTRHKNIKLQIL